MSDEVGGGAWRGGGFGEGEEWRERIEGAGLLHCKGGVADVCGEVGVCIVALMFSWSCRRR